MTELAPQSLYLLVQEYASFGIHRTGSPGDDAVSRWICQWLANRGIDAHPEAFSFRKFDQRAAHLLTGSMRIEGTPLYDAGATGPGGSAGRLAIFEDPDAATLDAALASGGDSSGVIAISGDPEGFVLLRNAERMDFPSLVPALQIARRDAAPILEATRSGATMRLVIDRNMHTAQATNVVVDIPAPGGSGLLVVMTPKSGWFQCAAERGGGIAIAMLLAQHIASMPERRKNVRLLFTSGHELGHRGLLAYLEQHPELRTKADFWLQLGASIGARNASGMRIFSREDALRDWFMPVLQRHGALAVALAEKNLRPHGESREIFDRPFLSIAGRHPYFHSPQDLPDRTVDAESVAGFGRAFAELLERLLR